ncbi:hypothetical protein KUCAC02_003579 [Chaenocephalus aceratus]|uniref:Uncharacterized protein n=1 Tax=Chaenocephalus aceratus TaxID=36190 RepID=A0ACB9WMT3_CHAAC|nr:hypothetical protein KUCAC02_003579 [Chaenocephalus aceratus]
MNYLSAAPAHRSTSFLLRTSCCQTQAAERGIIPSPFCSSLASRMPILDYGYHPDANPNTGTTSAPPPPQAGAHHSTSSLPGCRCRRWFQHHAELPGKHCRRRKARTVFSELPAVRPGKRFEIQRTSGRAPGRGPRRTPARARRGCGGARAGTGYLHEDEDDVDIEEDICSPDHH